MFGNGQSSAAGMVPVIPTRGGKPRRRLVHTVSLLPDAPSPAGTQESDQTAAGLRRLQAGRQPSDRAQMPAVQVRPGVGRVTHDSCVHTVNFVSDRFIMQSCQPCMLTA